MFSLSSIRRISTVLFTSCLLVGCATLPRLPMPQHWHLELRLSGSASSDAPTTQAQEGRHAAKRKERAPTRGRHAEPRLRNKKSGQKVGEAASVRPTC